jgi:hypothetical protein
MFTAAMPSMRPRRTITVEEYRQLKRRLFAMRCQYAKLLRTIQEQGETTVRRKQATDLERRISNVELRLAFSDIVFPDEPLTFGDITQALKRSWVRITSALSALRAEVHMLTKGTRPKRTHRAGIPSGRPL